MILLFTWMTIMCLKAVVFCCDGQANGQLMRIQLMVEHEFAITRLRYPCWGLIPAGSGQVYLSSENEKAGRFTISATENVHILMTIETPAELVLNPDNTIAFSMQTAYIQDGRTDASQARPIIGKYASFPLSTGNLIHETNLLAKIHELRTTVFLYGLVVVGDVDPGVYSGDVTVRVEYL